MSRPPHPSVSTGTLLELEIVYGKRRRHLKTWMGPDTPIHVTKDGRVIGRNRAFLAAYLITTAGNRCARQFKDFCIMGNRPFENPLSADFDHLDGDRDNRLAGNFGLTCPPCNRHAQTLQLKSIRVVASAVRERERKTLAHAAANLFSISEETQRSIDMVYGSVKYFFHPTLGTMIRRGAEVDREWVVNNLPDIVGRGRAVTYAKYIHEWVMQGYLSEAAKGSKTTLVRTGKSADALVERELGIKPENAKPALGKGGVVSEK